MIDASENLRTARGGAVWCLGLLVFGYNVLALIVVVISIVALRADMAKGD